MLRPRFGHAVVSCVTITSVSATGTLETEGQTKCFESKKSHNVEFSMLFVSQHNCTSISQQLHVTRSIVSLHVASCELAFRAAWRNEFEERIRIKEFTSTCVGCRAVAQVALVMWQTRFVLSLGFISKNSAKFEFCTLIVLVRSKPEIVHSPLTIAFNAHSKFVARPQAQLRACMTLIRC
jgi:hypothetical protein